MFRNYFKIALRNLRKHAAYSFINIAGLAVGLTCFLLISLYVKNELSYDRYNTRAGQIFKVVTDARTPGKESKFALTPAPLAEALVRDFPEVERATRLFAFLGNVVVSYNDKRFTEEKVFGGDSTFFEIFDLPLLAGDPKTALARPNTVVLTEAMARKYFGDDNPLGKTLSATANNTFDLQVTGVMQNIPANSHFHFDFLVSMPTFAISRNPSFISNINFHTYLLLRQGAAPENLEAEFPQLIKKYAASQIEARFGKSYEETIAAGYSTRWSLLPLGDIHLRSHREYEIEANGSMTVVYTFLAIAVIVLLIACVNFMNLATARAAARAREIGVRKVIGSNRLQLLRQFLSEAVVMSGLALIVALVLVELLLPGFNRLAGKQIATDFWASGPAMASLLGVALLTGLVAGSYPAFVLSGLRPTLLLKSASPAAPGALWVRRGLVIFQFAICISLICATLIVRDQLGFVLHRQLGFNKEQVLVIKRGQALRQQREAFKQQLLRNAGVVSAAASSTLPGKLFGRSTYLPLDAPPDNSRVMHEIYVDDDFIPTLGIELTAGRNFSPAFATDSTAVILNQAAAKQFGWTDPLGHQLIRPGNTNWRGQVIGVVNDFHFESLHTTLQPLVIRHEPYYQFFSVRVRPENLASTVRFVESTWHAFAPSQPFDYSFLDQDFDALYRAEQRTGKIFGLFALLAIFIACLGQIGLVAYTVEQRTKEIGIRKVLGATVTNVTALLSKDFVKLVLLANVIAWPVAWFAMNKWLQNFAYRIDISWWIFALAGGLALVIALVTVSTQAVRAALANPVESLRYE